MKLLFKLNGQKVVLFLVACFAVPGTRVDARALRPRPVATTMTKKQSLKATKQSLREAEGITKPAKGEKSKEYYEKMAVAAGSRGNFDLLDKYSIKQSSAKSSAEIAIKKQDAARQKQAQEAAELSALKQQTVQAKANLQKTTEQLRAEKARNLQLAKEAYAKAAQKRRELGWLGRNIFSRGKNREFKDAQIELLKGNRRLRKDLNENRIAKGKATIRDADGKKKDIDLTKPKYVKIWGNANKTGSTQKAWANWGVGK
jgi:hypothetical protein